MSGLEFTIRIFRSIMSLTDDDNPPEVLFEAMKENRDMTFIFELVDWCDDLQDDEELTEGALRGAAGLVVE